MIFKCPFCKRELSYSAIGHIYKCKEKPNDLTKDDIKEIYYKFNYGDDIFENIIRDYNNLYSLPMLKDKYCIGYKAVYYILNKYNIPIRNISTSQKLISAPKHRDTCLKKYGCKNVSQVKSVHDKKRETFIKHYGVDNIWKTKEYAKFSINRWASYSPEEKVKILKKWRNSQGPTSKLENKIYRYLDEIGISVISHFKFDDYYHSYDFLISGTNIIIEVNGDFWHANPDLYNENDVLNFPKNKVIAKDLWERDLINNKYAESKGFNVITIWEKDINTKSKEDIQIFITDSINNLIFKNNGTEEICKYLSED